MHKFLSLSVIKKFEPLMKREGVSLVARSPFGFLSAYKRAGGAKENLYKGWHTKREAFIARHMAQLISNDEPLYGEDRKPTRRHLALIAWAYSPDSSNLVKLARTI
jgi:hypothetical protein